MLSKSLFNGIYNLLIFRYNRIGNYFNKLHNISIFLKLVVNIQKLVGTSMEVFFKFIHLAI
ncbi:hypothetical protein EMIT036CA2_10902 [Chryseobacterium sp. IT-36CA2]